MKVFMPAAPLLTAATIARYIIAPPACRGDGPGRGCLWGVGSFPPTAGLDGGWVGGVEWGVGAPEEVAGAAGRISTRGAGS